MASASTNRVTLVDGERASLWYYPEKRIVHHQLRAFVHGDEFRSILEKGVEIFRKYGARKWLSDDRGHTPLTKEDSKWASEDWSKRVMATGWKQWAVVMPEKVVGQLQTKRWIKLYGEMGVTVRAFTNPDEAMAWLESQ